MPRHVESTRKVVAFLAGHAAVAKVVYPELPDHPDHALAKKLLPKGCGAVFSFDLKGGREGGRRFMRANVAYWGEDFAEEIAPLLADVPITIGESGIWDEAHAARMSAAGYDAVLVGEALVRAEDPAGLVARLRRA